MKQKIFFFIIILSLLSSCCAKKSVIETKEVIKIDSVLVTKEVVKRFTDTLTVQSPCDSVTGKLKPFKRSIIIPQGNITIEGINNEINANIDLKGYKNTIEKKYKNIYEKKMSEIVKSKTPFYHWVIHFLSFFIILLLFKIR